MTEARIREFVFDDDSVRLLRDLDPRYSNWPVVYALDGPGEVYVGESLNVATRMKQHRDSEAKNHLARARVVVDDTFNKSACLDLESYLIRLFAGDGKLRVLNRNEGVTDAEYYERPRYRKVFAEIVDELREAGLFDHTVTEIENSDLFKLSPFKALNADQAIALESILDGLFDDIAAGRESTAVVRGEPGTGKTILAIYLIKLLRDIARTDPASEVVSDSVFAEHFTIENAELLRDFRIALVVPQQSLRGTIAEVFRRTPGLDGGMVVGPFDIGEDGEPFDLVIVDETHRLNQRASQSTGSRNTQFRTINERLFGADDLAKTQLDWIVQRSTHQILLLDSAQRVRPADLPVSVLDRLVSDADETDHLFPLTSQMRVAGGEDYIRYVRAVLAPDPDPLLTSTSFPGYDFLLFDHLPALRARLRAEESRHGLARLVAGFAWPWASKRDRDAYDIEIDGCRLRWNRQAVDWISSPGAVDEVGSIHTVQGYDLNYAGVIIGPDLRYDVTRGRLAFDRSQYFDRKGKENNRILGTTYSDDDLLELVTNIYSVLLTRGMRGTFVYACDPDLHAFLARFIPRG